MLRRRTWPRAGAVDRERGAAVVDFVLVLLVLLPLVFGILQVGLVIFVRTTLASAASEGARYGATLGHGPDDAVWRTRTQLNGALADSYADDIDARYVDSGGVPLVEVTVRARVPALGIGGPAIELEVTGHAVSETP